MRRVSRSEVETPTALDGEQSTGGRERSRAIAFYDDPTNGQKSFPFKAYKDDTVKDALNDLFHHKCAYCESYYGATQPMDVEHYRPKGGVAVGSELQQPGYYWLAADWTNLLPSCIDCNRSRRQEVVGGGVESLGKANAFPIDNPGERARRPEEEAREKRLLLDPCRDRPDTALEFSDGGVVRPRLYADGTEKPKAVHSIRVYGLMRVGLCLSRRRVQMMLEADIRKLATWIDIMNRYPDETAIEDVVEEQFATVARYGDDDQPHAAMARQIIARMAASLGLDL